MNPAQRARFDAYYQSIYKDFKKQNLTGKALTEWKYQRYMKDYLATAASLDRNIERTLNYLDKHGLAQNTIVIYMSDQGFYMGEHGWFDKRFMYEESFRTPMVMRYPGHIAPGSIDSNMVMNVDIGPTLLQAAGVPIPNDMQGLSFLSQVLNKKYKGRKAMYYHYYENGEHAVSPHFGISTGRYKLIRFYKRVNSWELYDLQNDKQEMKNVYDEKEFRKVQARMKRLLKKTIKKYDDSEAARIMNEEILKSKPKPF